MATASTTKTIDKISDNISQTIGVETLANRPNSSSRQFGDAGLTPELLKQRFDRLPNFIIAKVNELIDIICGGDMAKYIAIDSSKDSSLPKDSTPKNLRDLLVQLNDGTLAKKFIYVKTSSVAIGRKNLEEYLDDLLRATNTNRQNITTNENKISLINSTTIPAINTAIDEVKSDVGAVEQSLGETNSILNEVKSTVENFFAQDAAVNNTIDTLREIVEYIKRDETNAAGIAERIGSLESKVNVENVSEAINTAIGGVKSDVGAELDEIRDRIEGILNNFYDGSVTIE